MAELRDAEVLLSAEERADIAEQMAAAELLLHTGGSSKAYADALRILVDTLSDLQIGSETSDFVFPLSDAA